MRERGESESERGGRGRERENEKEVGERVGGGGDCKHMVTPNKAPRNIHHGIKNHTSHVHH